VGGPAGEKLYLTKSYRSHGFTYRAQQTATAMLGPTPGMAQQAVRSWLQQRTQGKELMHG
jgi:hypothetical protein